jgi:hypothetical protein
VVHGFAGDLLELGGALLAADEAGRVADGGGAGRHVDEHQGPGPDLGAVADADVAEQDGAGADEHAVADLGVAVADGGAGAAQGDAVQDGDVAADAGRLAHHQARGVVEQHARPDGRRRVDVHVKHLRHPALHQKRQRLPVVLPQPVRHPVRLARQKPLEIQQTVTIARARRVLRPHRPQILPYRPPYPLIAPKYVHNQPKQLRAQQRRIAQLVAQMKRQRPLQRPGEKLEKFSSE